MTLIWQNFCLKNDTKMTPKWQKGHKNDIQMTWNNKLDQNDTKMTPKWYQNDNKLKWKCQKGWHENDTKMKQKWQIGHKNDIKMTWNNKLKWKWNQNDTKMTQKWLKNDMNVT